MSRSSSRTLAVGCALLATLASACTVLRTPERVARAVIPGKKETAPPIEDEFLELSRYLDQMVFRIAGATQEFELAAGTPEAKLEAARLRLESLRQTIRLASGRPLPSVLDLIALVAVFRWHLEDHEIPEVWGEAARPLAVAAQRVEDDGWELVGRYLETPQVEEARGVLARWRERNPYLGAEALAEFPSFRTLAEGLPAKEGEESSTSLLGLVGLDPMSELEPAKREIELTRQLGQRVLYFGQRAPQLVAAEMEFGILRVRASPEVRGTLDEAERITASLESFATTAAALPEAIRREREALVLDLERTQEPLARLLTETRATLEAGERMSAEVDRAVSTLDAFIGRFDKPDEPEPAPEPESTAKPFDVTEYGQAAERVGVAASELTALLSEVDRKLPELQRVLDETAARGEQSIDRAASRLLQVGLVLIGAATLASCLVLLVRVRTRRRTDPPRA